VSERPLTGQTRGQSVASMGPNLIEVATTVILWSELLARENRCRDISRQRELLPAGQCPTSADLDLIEGTNTGLDRPAKGWINRFSVTENWTQTSTLPVLSPLETVSEQPASTDQPLDQSPSERGMEPINA